jgi:serine protease Do
MKYIIAIVVSSLAVFGLLLSRQQHSAGYATTETPVYRSLYAGDPGLVDPGGPVDFTEAAAKAVRATVHVAAKVKNEWGEAGWSSGSGAILAEDGIIVTNNHVVKGAESITVTLNNHHTMKAVIVGADGAADIAVLKVDAHDLPYFSYGNSNAVKVGQWALAIGYPLMLETTVTAGIISARRDSLIQTDAAVNVGNSGGPLIDRNGELIGINAAFTTNTGSYVGYSYAIPSTIVKRVVNMILGGGNAQVIR